MPELPGVHRAGDRGGEERVRQDLRPAAVREAGACGVHRMRRHHEQPGSGGGHRAESGNPQRVRDHLEAGERDSGIFQREPRVSAHYRRGGQAGEQVHAEEDGGAAGDLRSERRGSGDRRGAEAGGGDQDLPHTDGEPGGLLHAAGRPVAVRGGGICVRPGCDAGGDGGAEIPGLQSADRMLPPAGPDAIQRAAHPGRDTDGDDHAEDHPAGVGDDDAVTGGRDNEHEKAEAHGRGTAGDLSGHGGPGLDGKYPGGTRRLCTGCTDG